MSEVDEHSRTLRIARVLRVSEGSCRIWDGDRMSSVRFAANFPTPHTERVSPGHLVAIVATENGEIVLWRWYDAVVVNHEAADSVRIWEPEHGEVVARRRALSSESEPGTRVWASAGLAGAEWWAAGAVTPRLDDAEVELDAVAAMYTGHDLWPTVFGA